MNEVRREPQVNKVVHLFKTPPGVARTQRVSGGETGPALAYSYSQDKTAATQVEVQGEEEVMIEQAESRFRWELLHAIEAEPLENGYFHPAESIVDQALKDFAFTAASWIQSVYFEYLNRKAVVSAVILRCVGRLAYDQIYPWGVIMALSGLSYFDIEVRDAAVRAMEMWEDPSLVEILRAHDEKVEWLAHYINEVILDLEIGMRSPWSMLREK
jgi:hypothetical protein